MVDEKTYLIPSSLFPKRYDTKHVESCCPKLKDAEDVGFDGGHWNIFCEGCTLYLHILYCPFCGFKLSRLKKID